MNAVLYARVSTDKQAEKELSIPAQLNAMREYARKNGWTISEEFLEPGASARTTDRPMLKRMLARCKEAPKVDVVVVHKVDRLARDLYGHATIKTLLKQRGIRLASVVENMDDSITGQLVENIMASLAEFYSANLGEEVKKGMHVMIQRGEWPHLPPRGYRLTRTADRRPLAVPFADESVPIADAFRLYATSRYSLRDIADELLSRGIATGRGKPLPLSYVRKMLENPFYCGRLRWKGVEHAGRHQAVVPETLFLQVQKVLRYRFKNPGERGHAKYLMRGLAICSECGHLMTAERHKLWTYYRCVEHAHGRCASQMSNTTPVHRQLMNVYRRMHLPAEWKAAILAEARAAYERISNERMRAAAGLRRRHERLLGQEHKLTESFTAGDTSANAYKSMGAKLRDQIATVEEALQSNSSVRADVIGRIEGLLKSASSMVAVHQSLRLDKQQQLLRVVFRHVAINAGSIVDFSLNPPFDALFGDLADPPGGQPGPGATQFELRSPTPAIKSLFEFDFDAFERILSDDRGVEANDAPTSPP